MPDQSAPTENVVIVTLDCARPEAISCYDDRFPFWRSLPVRPDTPYIDSLAADGARYTNAVCQAPFTPASHASILTGLNPYNHGIRHIIGHRLADETETLAETLSEKGYSTAGFIGAHALSSSFGLDRGFDQYSESFEHTASNWELGSRRTCEEVTDCALSWLSEQSASRNFLFVHYFDAHDGDLPEQTELSAISRTREFLGPIDERLGRPLQVRSGYGRRFHLRQIQRIDRQLGRLLDHLRDSGMYEDTLIFVLADHGDAFGEHGEFNHREFLYDTTVRIPFIAKFPAVNGDVVDRIVRSTDIVPTVFDYLGIVPEGGGVSLARDEGDGTAYCETRFEAEGVKIGTYRHNYAGLRTRQWKYIQDRQSGVEELYELEIDPNERENVVESYPDVVGKFRQELTDRLRGETVRVDETMSTDEFDDVSDRLKGLGYL